jgi:hypothetical protein
LVSFISENLVYIGEIVLQGPHHVAVKSTMTGLFSEL